MRFFVPVAALASAANAYFLVGQSIIATERIDPIVSPGSVSGHVHAIFGGSKFRTSTTTASLRQSYCTSVGIKEDNSAYWFPQLYFQWKNGSFTSVNGGGVVYYLFSSTPGTTTPFPEDFRMISGDMTLRSYNASDPTQQAISFLCLDFQGTTPPAFSGLPDRICPSGIRSQINFPSCWDGKNVDSPDHKSHVAFLSGGPDKGTCSNPSYPKTLPRIFSEIYWSTQSFDNVRNEAANPKQPFVFAMGDTSGYGYHGDFYNGWQPGVLQKAVDNCHCNDFGDPTCCANQGIFTINKDTNCKITKAWDEQTTGTLPKLPGNNPIQPAGTRASYLPNNYFPAAIQPIYEYIGDNPPATGQPVGTGRVLVNIPTNAAPPAATPSVSSSSTVPPAQPTPKDPNTSPSPVPPVPSPPAPAVSSSSTVPPAQPTPPKDPNSSPSPVPSSPAPIGGGNPPTTPIPKPTDDPDHDDYGFCYSTTSKEKVRYKKHAHRHMKRNHIHRRMHNAAFEESF